MRRFALLIVAIIALCAATRVSAVPLLSMDIAGGSYDSSSGTIIASGNPFTLYALFNTEKGKVAGTYYLAAAIVPKTENPPVTSFGSFSINGVSYSGANMLYGNPPASIVDNNLDLQSHGIYDTHYVEIAFNFDKTQRADLYNSQNNPGGLQTDASGAMIFEDFQIDVSGLAAGYAVHFDLYNLGVNKKGAAMVKDFAPFSHDAQSGTLSVADASSTMMLLGIAMLAVEGFRRRFVH